MAYQNEMYHEGGNSYCERCRKIHGTTVDATKTRMVIIEAGQTAWAYLCRECIDEIYAIMHADMSHVSRTFKYNRVEMMSYGAFNRKAAGVNGDHLRATLSRYEGELREDLKKIRAFEGKYTDRNVVVKVVMDHFKNFNSAVNKYLEKT